MTQTPQLRPLGAALGTEVLGIDLAKPLEPDTFTGITAAFAEHPVLVFRDQDLGAPELAALGRRFGVPRPHALIKYRHVDCPEVSWLTNVEETGQIDWYGVKRAIDWHTDSTFEDALPLLAMLHAKGERLYGDDKGGPRRNIRKCGGPRSRGIQSADGRSCSSIPCTRMASSACSRRRRGC